MLDFAAAVDLATTMECQLAAAPWRAVEAGRWRRLVYVGGRPVPVKVAAAGRSLEFFFDAARDGVRERLEAMFTLQVGGLDLDRYPGLAVLREQCQGVVLMAAPPLEMLVLAAFDVSGRAPGRTQVPFDAVVAASGGLTLAGLAALPDTGAVSGENVRRLRLVAQALLGVVGDDDGLAKLVADDRNLLAEVATLPHVNMATAPRVVIAATGSRIAMPTRTALLRICTRLGLLSRQPSGRHDVQTAAGRLARIGDIALVSELLIWLGRAVCTTRDPRCGVCPLASACPSAAAAADDR
ncbi:hypothetical protein [Longispora fulva]|uniref:hypothetical protein n=1 Tax=Longispora fulva TaxID=619741 RepID=UPI0019427203|nr:hypothetical protein [Longispora fulva]